MQNITSEFVATVLEQHFANRVYAFDVSVLKYAIAGEHADQQVRFTYQPTRGQHTIQYQCMKAGSLPARLQLCLKRCK